MSRFRAQAWRARRFFLLVVIATLGSLSSPLLAQDDRPAMPLSDVELDYVPRILGVQGDLHGKIVGSLEFARFRKPSSLSALRARLAADVETIEKILRSESYYGFRIEHRVDSTRTPVDVEITIQPGPAYKMTRFEMNFLDDVASERPAVVLKEIGITLGEPGRAETIVDGQAQLISLLGRQGYPYATVENRTVRIHHADQTVAVTLDIRARQKTLFGPVSVRGNEQTDTAYILSLADLKSGALFSLKQLDDARRRLFASGLFETVAIAWPQVYPGRPDLPVTIEVKERDSRTIALGGFYSSSEGAGVEASWVNRNLFGHGERLEVGTRFAEREMSAYTDFLKPNLFRSDQSLTARADLKALETDAYDQSSASATVGLRRKLNERWSAGLATALEASRIEEVSKPEQHYLVIGFPGQVVYDGANDLFDPSEGVRLTFDAAPNQVTGDSTDRFILGSVSASAYNEVLADKRLILAARGRVATLLGAEIENIPASRRIYAGGGGSIRGYAYQSVGPLDSLNRPTGGRSLMEMSIEARLRVTDSIGIVPFIDGGTASEDISPTTESWQWAAGLGVRYYTALGPLRFDFAVPLNKRPGIDDPYAIYVSIGQAF